MSVDRGVWKADARRFLFIAPQGLGDALELTPAIAAVKAEVPRAGIDVAVMRPGSRELFEGLPMVDRVIDLPFWEKGSRAFLTALLRNARVLRYDAAFLGYPAARPEYQILALALGAKRRIAHRYFAPSPRNLLWLNTTLVPVSKTHNVTRNMEMLRACGFEAKTPRRYEVPADWVDPAPRRNDVIAVHVGNIAHDGLDARRWPSDYFIDLIRRLRDRAWSVYVLSGPSEREVSKRVAAESNAEGFIERPLAEVARFISTCGAVVANDSGIAHLAAAVGTPVMAIFGPTPTEFGPYGERTLAFRPSPCPPCFDPRLLNTDCALGIDYACLKRDAPVELVERALLEFLGASPAAARPEPQASSQ